MNKEITPLPWSVLSQKTNKGQSILVTDCRIGSYRYIGYISGQSDADRITACVNAMSNIDDPQKLREAFEAAKMLKLDQYNTLKAMFDRLLEINSDLVDRLSWSNTFISNESVVKFNQESLDKVTAFVESIPKTEEQE